MSRLLIPALGLLQLAGCSAAVAPPSTPPTDSAPATASAAPPSSAAPSPATSSPATPSVAASPPTVRVPVQPSAGKPRVGVPDAAGAINVAGDIAGFASPSGRIWCATDGTAAWCHFPLGMATEIPSGEEVCPGEELDVTGVMIGGAAAGYFCSGDPTAYPVPDGGQVAWHKGTGFPWQDFGGLRVAVLPYGKKIVSGRYLCASEQSGVTCANTATKHGFRISRAGPEFF